MGRILSSPLSFMKGFIMVGNFYSEIYNILIDTIYGDMALNPDMTLSVSLISTCLSLLVTLAPVLITGSIFIWILKRV